MDNRPIGMFDSGVGGLTVLKEYTKLMPNEDYIYYADTKHMPYGNKTKEQIISYSEEIIKTLIKKNVKAIVIACGTSSSLAYHHLQQQFDIPIFDIITPTAQLITGKNIGVIATEASVKSDVWNQEIRKYHPQVHVYSQACPKLASLAEQNRQNSFISKLLIKKYLKELKKKNLDTLILRLYTLSSFFSPHSKGTGKKCNSR